MSKAFLTPTGMRDDKQLRLHAQIEARTTRKTEWNTLYGANMAMAENYQKAWEKKDEVWRNSFSRLVVMQSATCGTAEDRLKDLINEIKQTKYYRQEVKRALNGVDCEFLENWSKNFMMREYSRNQTLVLDIMDKCVETLKPFATKLYWCIKQEMDKESVPDSAIKAKVYEVALLVDFACVCYDAHMAVGPFLLPINGTTECEKELKTIISRLWDGETMEGLKTKRYDYDYACKLKDMRPTALKMQMATIKHGVCGAWTHDKGGFVDQCITAIRNKVADYYWLDDMSMGGLIDNGQFAKEIELLNQFEIFKSGDVELTIDLLEAVCWYRHGRSDEEIKKVLEEGYKNVDVARARIDRVMGVVKLLRLCAENEGGAEYFNSLDRVWREGGRDAAVEFHLKAQEVIKKKAALGDARCFKTSGNAEGTVAMPSGDAEGTVAGVGTLYGADSHSYSEEDVMAAMLSAKFGKVTKFKEKRKGVGTPFGNAKGTPFGNAKGTRGKTDNSGAKVANSCEKAVARVEGVGTQCADALKLEVQPPTKKRTNNRWSEEEEEFLCSEVKSGIPYGTIGKELHRTAAACYQRFLQIQKRVKTEDPQLKIENNEDDK